MTKRSILLMLLCSFGLSGCSSTEPERVLEVTQILQNAKKSYDPTGAFANYETEIIQGMSKNIGTKDVANIIMKFKKPNKMLVITSYANGETEVKGFNGSTGWEYSTKTNPKLIVGQQLKRMKFRSDFFTPNRTFAKIFSNIENNGIVDLMGEPNYKLVCTPKSEYNANPVTIFLDKKSFRINKMIEKQDIGDGDIEIKTVLADYVQFGDIFFPSLLITEAGDQITELSIESIDMNLPIDDHDFDPPVEFSKR